MDKEFQIRQRVKDLKNYYTNLVLAGTSCLVCIIIWLVTGAGYFWPIWIILASGSFAFVKGFHLNKVPSLEAIFPFLRPEWEAEEVKKLLETEEFTDSSPPAPKSSLGILSPKAPKKAVKKTFSTSKATKVTKGSSSSTPKLLPKPSVSKENKGESKGENKKS